MQKDKYTPSNEDLWFLPLGGSGEIGMNLNLYGHDGAWLMVDLGITFHDRLGIEILTPNPEFIAERYENLVGLVLTHAHEDHVGAVPYLWPALRCPVYATRFTANVLRQKLREVSWGKQVPIIEVPLSGKVDIGPFGIEFVTLTHSIPEPNAVSITTPVGQILHTGDWKLDDAPQIGETTNAKRLKDLGDKGVLALVCDSTNVFVPGFSGSEEEVRKVLAEVIKQYRENRLVLACFASNVARLKTIIEVGIKSGRKIALIGRSLLKMVEAAQDSGYLSEIPDFINEEAAMTLPPHKVLMISTGSQGEGRSALARMAACTHPRIRLGPQDVVLFSSRVIPGNESAIGLMQNRLVGLGVQIITTHDADIHVSGHPAQEELKQMYAWIRPEILIPVHGELRHMEAQAQLGSSCGIPQTFVPQNGQIFQLAGKKPGLMDQVIAGRLAYDGNRMIPLDSECLRQRGRLSVNGAIVVTLVLDRDQQLKRPPQLTVWGLAVDEEEFQDIEKQINKVIRQIINEGSFGKVPAETFSQVIRRVVGDLVDKRPLVDVHIVQM